MAVKVTDLCYQHSDSTYTQTGKQAHTSTCNSSTAPHKLAQNQKNLCLPKDKLKQDVSTRYNLTLYMVELILEQKMALTTYAAENNIAQLD